MRVNLPLVGYGCTQTHTRIYPYPFLFTLSITTKNGYCPAGRCHPVDNHNLKLSEHIFFLPLLARPLPLGAANAHYCSHPSTLSSPREQGHPATVLFVPLVSSHASLRRRMRLVRAHARAARGSCTRASLWCLPRVLASTSTAPTATCSGRLFRTRVSQDVTPPLWRPSSCFLLHHPPCFCSDYLTRCGGRKEGAARRPRTCGGKAGGGWLVQRAKRNRHNMNHFLTY
jgi:hypothetical protein